MADLVGAPNLLTFWTGIGSPSVSNFALNASTDALEVIFNAHEAATLTRLGFRQGTLTGVAPVFRVSLQGVDASGNPDGTIKGGATCYVDYTPTAGNNSAWQWVTLGASYTCTRGEALALVIAYQSGTIDGSNNCSFTSTLGAATVPSTYYAIQNDAGSRTRTSLSPVYGYGSAGTAYGMPVSSTASHSYSSASTPDERALYLTVPTAFCASYKITGVQIVGAMAAAGTCDFVLYDTDGTTVLQSVSLDTDQIRTTAVHLIAVMFDEVTLSTLTAGSTYRLAVKPTSGTHQLVSMTMAAAADMDAYPFGNAWAYASSRTDAGAWTEVTTQRYAINPILDDVTVPSGGGGGLILPRPMNGGYSG